MYELLRRKGQTACITIILIKIERIPKRMTMYKGSRWDREDFHLNLRIWDLNFQGWMVSHVQHHLILFRKHLEWIADRWTDRMSKAEAATVSSDPEDQVALEDQAALEDPEEMICLMGVER
ncbi:MAG: hypothetical protein K0R46_1451 [Herbinix sp.]|jgi:hypothetical protein|nr:hypothetical protein [Herbinix sp.]